jgi:hypothetical protein
MPKSGTSVPLPNAQIQRQRDLAEHVTAGAPALTDSSRAARSTAKVVQLGTSHFTVPEHLDAVDTRTMQREGSLDSDTVRSDAANGEVLIDATTAAANDNTLERLHALSSSLDHSIVDTDVIAGAKRRDVILDELLLDLPNCIDHGLNLPDVSKIKD